MTTLYYHYQDSTQKLCWSLMKYINGEYKMKTHFYISCFFLLIQISKRHFWLSLCLIEFFIFRLDFNSKFNPLTINKNV